MKRKLVGVMTAVLILTNSITVFASTKQCESGTHSPLVLYSRELVARTKTGEHVVSIDGREAVCYIYTESYNVTYYCQTCGAYLHSTVNDTDVHSLGK